MPALHRIRVDRPLLGAYASIVLEDARREETLARLAEVAIGRMARVGALMSFHDRASEVARLNACAHTHPLAVHPWTAEVVGEALRLATESAGAFEFVGPPQGGDWFPSPTLPSYRDLVLLPTGRIRFRRPVTVNLDAVARGFAVDKAIEYLRESAVAYARIEVGGELRVIGVPAHQDGFFHLRDPRSNGTRFIAFPMPAPAAATVSTAVPFLRKVHRDLRRLDPFRHPVNGRPLRSNISLSIFAGNCLAADALLRAAWCATQEQWLQSLAREHAAAALLTAKGEVVMFAA